MTTISDNTLDRALVEDTLSALGANDDDTIRTDYTGRAMYGQPCLGIALPDNEVARFSAELAAQLVLAGGDNGYDTATDLFAHARTDNLGFDTILYFPGWQLAE